METEKQKDNYLDHWHDCGSSFALKHRQPGNFDCFLAVQWYL